MNQSRPILLTGFGPFPGVRSNASAHIVRRIAQQLQRSAVGPAVVWAVLNTEWATAGKQIAALLQHHRPFLAVHFGVSSKAIGFELESVARNRAVATRDVHGRFSESPRLMETARPFLKTTLPVELAVESLRARGLRARLSRDAGGYICNAVYFHSLLLGERQTPGHKAIFVHLPSNLRRRERRDGDGFGSNLVGHGMSETEALEGATCVIDVFTRMANQ